MNACPGPAPFDPVAEPCCEEHDIALTRESVRRAIGCGKGDWSRRPEWLRIASHAGVHPEDMARFVIKRASLTHENRRRIRAHLGGGA